uniref:ATP synthase complex subunit 8 n=1 Tax=Anaplecta calosoma TaxID=1554546 RepID=A0A2P1H9C1_9NEOP|nr:ATP synthase F0 subunit 8 [Anaplecta calosoma]
MPQMMPLSWLMLFMLFSATFVVFNIMSYFNFNYIPQKNSKKEILSKKTSWKW